VLSATNVSLVPYEMLACGCIPVVNDEEHTRVALDNAEVVYASPTPFELAGALSDLVSRDIDLRRDAARRAAASVSSASWDDAADVCEHAVREAVARATAGGGSAGGVVGVRG
jgi:hypothetical protein